MVLIVEIFRREQDFTGREFTNSERISAPWGSANVAASLNSHNQIQGKNHPCFRDEKPKARRVTVSRSRHSLLNG